MKKSMLLVPMVLGASVFAYTQTNEEPVDVEVTYDQCTRFTKTPPLSELLKYISPVQESENEEWEAKDRKQKPDVSNLVDRGIPENNHIDPVVQSTMGTRAVKSGTLVNWQGLGSGAFPPDPTGAVGPDHYVQAINSSYRVWNKDGTGAAVPHSLNSLLGSGDGDPIVMYDRFADRWFISQFHAPDGTNPNNTILIAVSETADALGAYYLYEFTFSQFPDYPKYGVWSNAYLMTANTTSNDCVAFERDKMLVGDPTALKINMSFPSFYQFFNSVAPAYAEGPTEPDADEPAYFFAVQDDSWSGVSTDHIKVLKATFNWSSPGSSTVTVHQSINTAAFNTVFTPSWDDISQPGTSQKLDAVTGIFMYRAQYRRFTGYNVIMLCHTVDVDNTNRAGVRWYELREENDGVWYIYQQGTYSPDNNNNRWLGNIAMDQQGNIAMAYSFVGPSDYAGIRYTGRFKNDPLGQMTVPEQIAVEGTSAQTVTNRYGDYSQMTMDPDDDMTFWFTGEYLSGGSPKTRIFAFSTWHLLGEENMEEALPFFNAYQPSPEIVRVVWRDLKDQNVTASIVDMNGKMVASTTVNSQTSQEDINVSGLASGIYLISLTGEQTNLQKKVYLGN